MSSKRKSIRWICLSFFLFSLFMVGKTQDNTSSDQDTYQELYSEVLSEKRNYWVSLPPSYNRAHEQYKKYPICIILDGDVHFSPAANTIHFMARALHTPEMIVVGIKNVNRARDYTPDKIKTVRKNDFGGGDNFLAFVETELIPELDKQYRTESFRILAGHSLGGLLATHTHMKENTIFDAFIAIDPSFGGWDDQKMDGKVAAVAPAAFQRPIYFASANSFDGQEKNEDRHQRLFHALKEKNNGSYNAKIEYFENEGHQSVPMIAWYKGLQFIFEGYQYHYKNTSGSTGLVENYTELSKRIGYTFLAPESLVNRMGYRALFSRDENQRAKALDFFILNTKQYPDSYNAFDSLGDGYQRLGQKEKAIVAFKKSLSLNPDNGNAKNAIQKLTQKD